MDYHEKCIHASINLPSIGVVNFEIKWRENLESKQNVLKIYEKRPVVTRAKY